VTARARGSSATWSSLRRLASLRLPLLHCLDQLALKESQACVEEAADGASATALARSPLSHRDGPRPVDPAFGSDGQRTAASLSPSLPLAPQHACYSTMPAHYIDVPTYKLSHGGSIPAVGLGASSSPPFRAARPALWTLGTARGGLHRDQEFQERHAPATLSKRELTRSWSSRSPARRNLAEQARRGRARRRGRAQERLPTHRRRPRVQERARGRPRAQGVGRSSRGRLPHVEAVVHLAPRRRRRRQDVAQQLWRRLP